MRLEFIHWPGNTEIALVDDDGSTKDRFYTSETHFYEDTDHGMHDGMRAAEAFAMLSKTLPAPRIEGAWAEHHPEMQRWRERHKDA